MPRTPPPEPARSALAAFPTLAAFATFSILTAFAILAVFAILATFPTLTAFPILTAFVARGAGVGGLRHRRTITIIVPALFTGLRAFRTGDRAAGEGNGGEKQGNAVTRHFWDQSK